MSALLVMLGLVVCAIAKVQGIKGILTLVVVATLVMMVVVLLAFVLCAKVDHHIEG